MRPANGIRVSYVNSRKGRGVFATKDFLPGDLIERAPLIEVTPADVDNIVNTVVERYWYELDNGSMAIGLGFTSLYNHSSRANAIYVASSADHIVSVVAHRKIKSGAEITINYNGDPDNKTKINFKEYQDPEPDAVDYSSKIHYLDEGGWSTDGWVWCGECDVKWTTDPRLVSCRLCLLRMLAERRKLLLWDPDTKSPDSGKDLSKMLHHTIQRLMMDGHSIYADIVREALSRLEDGPLTGKNNGTPSS